MTLEELKEQQRKSLKDFNAQMKGPNRKATEEKTRAMLVRAGLITKTGEVTEAYR